MTETTKKPVKKRRPKRSRVKLDVYVTIDSESLYPALRSKTAIKKAVDLLLKDKMPDEAYPTVRKVTDPTED